MIIHTLTIRCGQVAMAAAHAAPGATRFELTCESGSPLYGTLSNPFLDHAFRTESFRIKVDVHKDDNRSYDQDTVLKIAGKDELFHHTGKTPCTKPKSPHPIG